MRGWVPEFSFYRDVYGGLLSIETYAEVLPAAVRHVRWIVGGVNMLSLDDDLLEAVRRAVCAAAEAFAEWGEGQSDGFKLGSFSVEQYDTSGTTGTEYAVDAIVKELAGTGLSFTGAGR